MNLRSLFFLMAVMALFGSRLNASKLEQQARCRVPANTSSNLSVEDGRICLDSDPAQEAGGETARLVGYGGITEVVWKDRWRGDSDCNTNCDPDLNTCTSNHIQRSLATIQLDPNGAKSGANLTRILVLGGSCYNRFSAANRVCHGLNGVSELMPFELLADGKFNVRFVNNSDPGVDGNLNKCWEARFRYFLKEAERHGIVVIVSLFDENTMTGIGNTTWDNNPWNPNNNNLGNLLPTFRSGLPAFYNVCSNMTALTGASGNCSTSALNALGLIQKKYVTKIVDAVKKSGVRNVMFEVMNQARLEDSAVGGNYNDAVILAAWHNTVAGWFPDYLWVASIKKAQYQDMRRLLRECRSNASCKDSNPSGIEGNGNPFLVFWRTGIDVIKPHFSIWPGKDRTGDVCEVANDLFKFGKPVIFDDDGAPREFSNNNRMVAEWVSSLCGKPHGSMHFYHTKDGNRLQGKTAPACEQPDNTYMDCNALNSLTGNGSDNQHSSPTNLCGKIVEGINCRPNSNYCNPCQSRN